MTAEITLKWLMTEADPEADLCESIIALCATALGVEADGIKSKGCAGGLADAKHICRWFLVKYTHMTMKEIALKTGVNGHDSVLHSMYKVMDLIEVDKTFRDKVASVQSAIPEEYKPSCRKSQQKDQPWNKYQRV